MSKSEPANTFHRTLSLSQALAVGIGTMVGAGIFVFPGIAISHAGPAAMFSFAIAGVIALLVAFSAAELSTAMPENGGAYYYVSRAMGPAFGMFVGIGQWFGLVFASAFYLVGFGRYAVELLNQIGFRPGDPAIMVAVGTGLFLTILNIIGTKNVGKLQNLIVVSLTGILGILFLYGLVDSTSLFGDSHTLSAPLFSEGSWPVLSTVALIFTSFLGFVQIATIAGEIKEPYKNLPRALIGSVVIVGLLYVVAIYITSIYIPEDELFNLGENAITRVAEIIIGPAGGTVVIFAALLATLSSANASVLSSSRAVYALDKDGMIPGFASKVNERFGTPHVAILMAGLPISVIALYGGLEVLAEVAALLHLVFYGLICVSLVILRRKRPIWYVPTYNAPAGAIIPAAGALASFGIILFMRSDSLLIGLSILTISGLWYLIYARNKSLSSPSPPHILPKLREPKILLTVEFPDPELPPIDLFKAFRNLNLFVLGYRISPEQTHPEQSEDELDEETREEFENYLNDLSFASIDTVSQLEYTADYPDLLQNFLDQEKVHALLIPKPMDEMNRILVPIYREDQINRRLATIVRELNSYSQAPVSLFFVAQKESDTSINKLKAAGLKKFLQVGIDKSDIKFNSVEVDNVEEAILQISGSDDLVALCESQDDKREKWFSSIHENIRDEIKSSLLLIFQKRARRPDQTEQETAEEVVSDEES